MVELAWDYMGPPGHGDREGGYAEALSAMSLRSKG